MTNKEPMDNNEENKTSDFDYSKYAVDMDIDPDIVAKRDSVDRSDLNEKTGERIMKSDTSFYDAMSLGRSNSPKR